MKNTSKITLALAVIGTAAIVVYAARTIKSKRRLIKVSDEGYETAADILYPGKISNGKELHYGPVIPG